MKLTFFNKSSILKSSFGTQETSITSGYYEELEAYWRPTAHIDWAAYRIDIGSSHKATEV